MVIFLREFQRNMKAFCIWTLALALTSVGMLAFFPYMGVKAEMLDEMMKQFPKEMIAALSLESLNLGSILGYFAYVYQYIVLFAGVNAMLLGAGILSKEEGEKTIEFLLAKPVSRNTIITQKALYVLVYLIAENIVFFVANFFMIEAVKNSTYSFKALLLIQAGLLLMQITFASIGLLMSVFVVKTKTVFPASLGVVLGAYFINIISAISDKLTNLKYLSPLKYVNPADIVKNEKIDVVYIVIMLVVSIAATTLTYVFYSRKNISV